MRLLAFAFFLLLPGVVRTAAAQQPALAAYVMAEITVRPAATVLTLGDAAEQHRLKAIAHLGLGKPAAARRDVERLVALVPHYVPQPNDPAPFVTLVMEQRQQVAAAVTSAPALASNRD